MEEFKQNPVIIPGQVIYFELFWRPRWTAAHQKSDTSNVSTFHAFLRSYTYKSMCCLKVSNNLIAKALPTVACSALFFLKYWTNCLLCDGCVCLFRLMIYFWFSFEKVIRTTFCLDIKTSICCFPSQITRRVANVLNSVETGPDRLVKKIRHVCQETTKELELLVACNSL